MSDQALHDELKELVSEIIEVDEFNDDDNLVTELGVDSVMALEIVARIERQYRIRVPEEIFVQMKSLSEIVRITRGYVLPVNS